MTQSHCPFVATHELYPYYLVFIPFVILSERKISIDIEIGPCGQALFNLRDAIQSMYTHRRDPIKLSKDVVEVITMSLLLFARSNDEFMLHELCEKCSDDMREVKFKGRFIHLLAVKPFQMKGSDLQPYVDMLKSSSDNGYILRVTESVFCVNDVYMLFRASKGGFVLVRVHVKDWLNDRILLDSNNVEEQRLTQLTLLDGSILPVYSIRFSVNVPLSC